jgi:hypothetical protein
MIYEYMIISVHNFPEYKIVDHDCDRDIDLSNTMFAPIHSEYLSSFPSVLS